MSRDKKMTGYPSIDKPWEHGYSYFKRNPIIPNLSIYSLLKLLTVGKMEKTAIECRELSVTYKQMFHDAEIIAKALSALGVKYGDIVAVCMPNFYQAVLPFLACNRIGAITTYLNPGMSDEEIKGYLSQFNAPVLFNYERTQGDNFSFLQDTPTKYTITLKEHSLNDLGLEQPCEDYRKIRQIDFHSLGYLNHRMNTSRTPVFAGNDTALILYTSGSTGQPKSVVLTNNNIIAALMYMDNTSNWKKANVDSILVCVPFAYPYGFVTSMLASLFSGSRTILAPDIGKDTVEGYYAKNPCMVMGSPALLDLSIHNVSISQKLSSVRFFISGGDFLTVSHAEKGKQFFQEHNAVTEIGNGSGNAETVSIGTTPFGVKSKPETVGIVLVGSRAIVIDPETMEEKKYGEEGMLCISGKHVFKEYYKEPKLTADAKFIYKGKTYFKTGALGFLDEEGYFTLTGRASRFYIRSSLDKIYLDHVQGVISRFDCVYDCAVVKVPNEDLLYVNYAFVVLNEDWEANEETKQRILDLCRYPVKLADGNKDQLKDFEIPAKIIFIKELPRRNGTDKINYQELERQAITVL